MLHHEERHSQQWAREGYTHFLASYAWEQITGGNQTEEDAGLHDGGVQVRRKAGVATLALALLLAVSACDDPDAWHPAAPWAPSLRPAVGLRVEGDELVVWTGTPCTGVTRLDLSFDPGSRDGADLQFVAPAPGIEIETVTLLRPYWLARRRRRRREERRRVPDPVHTRPGRSVTDRGHE